MANIKITALPSATSLASTDIIPVVVAPGGAAATQQITYGALLKVPPARWQERQGIDVASANDLTLGADGNSFIITGTTTVNGIATADWIAGSQVCLIFSGALTLTHDGTPGAGFAPMYLSKSIDFLTAANTVMGFVFDGSVWQETFRKGPS